MATDEMKALHARAIAQVEASAAAAASALALMEEMTQLAGEGTPPVEPPVLPVDPDPGPGDKGVDVRKFGAKGDDTTDDTEAFKKALAASPRVWVPAGRYVVRDLTVPDGRELTGDGEGSRLVLPAKSKYMSCVLYLKGGNRIRNLVVDGNCKRQDLADVGGGAPSPPGVRENGGMHGVRIMEGAAGVELVDVLCVDAWTDGIYLAPGTKGVVLRRVTCDGNRRQGVSGRAMSKNRFEASVFKNSVGRKPGCGIDIETEQPSEHVDDVTVSDCRFEGNLNAGFMLDHKGGKVVRFTMERCAFRNNQRGDGIDLSFSGREVNGSSTEYSDLKVLGCDVERTLSLAANPEGGAGYRNVLIEGCKAKALAFRKLKASDKGTISGNNFGAIVGSAGFDMSNNNVAVGAVGPRVPVGAWGKG